jgi:hypothetical protein
MKPPSLPEAEWNFSMIDALSLPDATIYEYARTSLLIRKRLCACLDSTIRGKRIREHIQDALKAGRLAGREIREKVGEAAGYSSSTEESVGLPFIIMKMRPDFPNPWALFRVPYGRNPAFSRVTSQPDYPGRKIQDYSIIGVTSHILDIYWHGATVEKIVSDFEKWLRKQAEAHRDIMRPRGRPGQQPTAPLKWLAAYRLKQAGFTFESAKELLDGRKKSWPVPWQTDKGWSNGVPCYSDKFAWSKAVAHATEFLARLEEPLR